MPELTMKEKANFVWYFIRILQDEGDMFFSSNNVDTDYANIINRLDSQGYWAGNRVRYYFDHNHQFLHTEERKFGE